MRDYENGTGNNVIHPEKVSGAWRECSFFTMYKKTKDRNVWDFEPRKVMGWTDGIFNYYEDNDREEDDRWYAIFPDCGISINRGSTSREQAQRVAIKSLDYAQKRISEDSEMTFAREICAEMIRITIEEEKRPGSFNLSYEYIKRQTLFVEFKKQKSEKLSYRLN